MQYGKINNGYISFFNENSKQSYIKSKIRLHNRDGKLIKRKDLVISEDFNTPNKFTGAKDFFMSDEEYGRKNGNPYYTYEIALPKEFTNEKNWEIAKEWGKEHFGDDFVYIWAFHNPKGEHPHIHICFLLVN